jgi:hypothetical protein
MFEISRLLLGIRSITSPTILTLHSVPSDPLQCLLLCLYYLALKIDLLFLLCFPRSILLLLLWHLFLMIISLFESLVFLLLQHLRYHIPVNIPLFVLYHVQLLFEQDEML